MTARIVWKPRSLRSIDRQARQTADPVDRLRYVRNQMEPKTRRFERWTARRIAAILTAAIAVALLVWRIH